MIRSVTLVVRLSDPLDCRPIAYNTGCCKPQRSSYRDRLRGIRTRQSISEIIYIFCASKINRFKENNNKKKQTPFCSSLSQCNEESIHLSLLAFCTLDCKQKVEGNIFLLRFLGGRNHIRKREN